MQKKTEKNCRKMKHEKNAGKKLDPIPHHPNNYTDSELFWEYLPQYSIPTLIEVQQYDGFIF